MVIIMEGGLKCRRNSIFFLLRINGYLLSKSCRVSALIDPLLIFFTVELTLVFTASCRKD